MENIFREKGCTSTTISRMKYDKNVKEIKNLTKEFLGKMKGLSQIQKIDLIYANLLNKKPEFTFDTSRKLDRILFEQNYGKEIKHTEEFLSKKKKRFKFPAKFKGAMKKANKKGNSILVWYLNAKGIIETPMMYPMYSSNMIIIRNKPHEVDPRAFWRMGKYQCLLIKEIDRRPVSNLDYDEIKKRGDATDSDEFIIKAAMQATIGKPTKKPVNRTVIIVIGILVAVGLVYFLLS